jgi:hypothetical protein
MKENEMGGACSMHGDVRNGYKNFGRNNWREENTRETKRRWKDNIRTDLGETMREGVNLIRLS